jgi:hypothetical protein
VNPVVTNAPESRSITCFRCGEKVHLARNCRKPPKKEKEFRKQKAVGKRHKTIGRQPPDRLLYSVSCRSLAYCDYVKLGLDVGNREKLPLVVDSRANIILLKSKKLLGTTEFEPRDRVRVKSVEGSLIETHGSTETKILDRPLQIP